MRLLLVLGGCELFMPPEEPEPPQRPTPPVEPPEPPQPPEPPPEPPPGGVVVQDEVTVIPATTSVAQVTANSVSFAAPADHATGDVLVFDRSPATPNGLLRKVTAVSADRRTVTTEQATLEDVIESGTVEIGGTLKRSDLTAASRAMLADMGIVDAPLQTATDATQYDLSWNFPSVSFSREINGVPVYLSLSGNIALSLDYDLEGHYDGNVMREARVHGHAERTYQPEGELQR